MTVGSISVAEQNTLLSQLLSLQPSANSSGKKRFHNFDIDDGETVAVSDQVPAGRGLVFTRNVEPGHVLLTLHPDTLINVKSFKSFLHPDTLPSAVGVAGSNQKSPHRLSSSQLLSLLVARVKIESDLRDGRESWDATVKHEVLRLFVQTLPKSFETAPLTWSLIARRLETFGASDSAGAGHETTEQEAAWQQRFLQSLLSALPKQSQALERKVRDRFEKDWRRLCQLRESVCDLLAEPTLLSSQPDIARRIVKSIGVDTFLWAWLCVNSRCVFLPLGLADHADNFTLAPMLDMANHTPDPVLECKVRYASDGGLELCAPGPTPDLGNVVLGPGDECFITYGPHSNQVLLSEYGFVLPPRSNFLGDLSKNGKWRGSRYTDVLLDEEVEDLLAAQGASGAEKIELLQNRGYWGEFTIHPYPEPAHPSHRLIPALRLAALDLTSAGTAAGQAPKVAKVKAQPGVKAGKKAPYTPQAAAVASSDLDRWEGTLTGYQDSVSDENERRAHAILAEICAARRRHTERARQHLVEAQAILESVIHRSTGDSALLPDRDACALSLSFVSQLLAEEKAVLDLVSQAAHDQVEW